MSATSSQRLRNQTQGDLSRALDLLPTGIGLFDATAKLQYCNQPFRDLRDLPGRLCVPGTPLIDIIRHIAVRGDYGPGEVETLVRERFAAATGGEDWQAEQDTPGGRRLQIRHIPTREGGVVITYTDVTDARATESKLRESEERYELVSRAAAEGIYDWNVVTGALYVSTRVMQILGLEGRLTSQDWYARVHPDDAESYRQALRDCFRSGAPKVACQYRIRTREGTYRWIEDHGLPVRDATQRVIRLAGCVSDITQRRVMEQALRDSEQRYATAMHAINESVYEWNIETDEMYYSPRLHEMLQLTTEELRTRQDWIARIHPDDLGEFREANRKHLKGMTDRLQVEYRFRHSDGSWHWARQHGLANRRADGRAWLMVGSTGDITAEKNLVEELERTRRQLHDALETIGEGFVLFDAQDRIVMCNSRYRSWFQNVADKVVPGNTFQSFVRAAVDAGLFPAAKEDPDEFMRALMAKRRNPTGPREQYLSSGIWLQVSDYKMKDGLHVGVYTDISELKQQQAQLAAARAEAEAALTKLQAAQQQLIVQGKMASLGQLTAGIAHEIKNPLNFVNNFSALSRELLGELEELVSPLVSGKDGTSRQVSELLTGLNGNLSRIAEHGARADRIVKNMLQHSRADGIQRRVVAVNTLVSESIDLAYHSARVEFENFEVELERHFDASAGDIDCFAQDLSRALINIISNGFYAAHKHSSLAMGRKAKLAVTTHGSDGDVSIRIRDNGPGIPPQLRDRVFTPFFTTKPPGEGTGLGLSLSYDIVVKQHGGEISFVSVPDQFTEFQLRMPRTAPQPGAAASAPPTPSAES